MTRPRHPFSAAGRRWRHATWAVPSLTLVVVQMRAVLGAFDRAVLGTLHGGDALLQSGILAWTVRHLGRPAGWVDLPIFFPAPSALMAMDTLLGQALVVAPWAAVADPPPAALYNAAVAATLVLAALAGAVLWLAGSDALTWPRRVAGAGLCALFLVGSPFTTWQLGMLNQISPPWVVFLLAALWVGWRRFVAGSGAVRWWWAAAACLAMQAAWGWYGFADAVFVVGTCALAGAVAASRRGRARRLARQVAGPAAAAAVVVLALAWPYLGLRSQTPEFRRDLDAVHHYSARPAMVGDAGPHRLSAADLRGDSEPAAVRAMRNTDGVLHPGWIAGLCAVIGVWRWRRHDRGLRRYGLLVAAVGVVGMVMALGHSVRVPGTSATVLLPFGVLREAFLPFESLRAPVRFAYLAVVAVAWWATVGLVGGAAPLTRRRAAIVGLVALLVWVESIPMALLAVPVPVDGRAGRGALPLPAGTAVLTVPAPRDESEEAPLDALWLHRALAHGHPVTGGMSGWVPPVTRRLRRRLAAAERGDLEVAALLDSLRARGVAGVEVALEVDDARRAAFWQNALEDAGYRGGPSAAGYRFYPLTRDVDPPR